MRIETIKRIACVVAFGITACFAEIAPCAQTPSSANEAERIAAEIGVSPASMILEEDGCIRCQAWMPFESFVRQPKEAKWRLMGSVIDKLWSFSEGVASVTFGGDPEDGVGSR